jgi:DNA (cytosine-5)-methyltransferase 1
LNHLDLFSGIGGFALAVDTVWPNSTHTFVEIDPFCQEVLRKHWPKSKIYGDIRTITNTRITEPGGLPSNARKEVSEIGKVHILTGGFPCQPFSVAGKKRGTADDRHLWPEMLRVIKESQPTWVIGENVAGIVNMVLEQTCLDLEAEGYEVWPIVIPACAVNAPHRRDRVWIVAHRQSEQTQSTKSSRLHTKPSLSSTRSDDTPNPPSKPTRNEKRTRVQEEGAERPGGYSETSWERNWPEVAAELCRVDDGIPKRLDRNPRLKALGNVRFLGAALTIDKASE